MQNSWEKRSTDEKYIQRWAPNGVFFIFDHGHDYVDLLGLVSVFSACQMFAKCVDDPQVLQLLQKCFVRIKKAIQITEISHENRAKNWKKNNNNNHEKKKD